MAEAVACSEWKAIHDWQPGRPGKLTVTGICKMTTPGYRIVLKRKVPQGINPAVLLLEKEIIRPQGTRPQVIAPTPVSFEEITQEKLQNITILPDDATCIVQDVH